MGKLVAALYIDPGGPYPAMEGVDSWDAERDADYYPGPYPVVAHPPCGPWGRMKGFNKYQLAHHAMLAVGSVRRFGGVLEHPQHSSLWRVLSLPLPGAPVDAWGGWTFETEQVRWGHAARKATWLYVVGCAREEMPPIPAMREPTVWVCGGRTGERPARIGKATAEQGKLTPPMFAEWLCAVAASCRVIY